MMRKNGANEVRFHVVTASSVQLNIVSLCQVVLETEFDNSAALSLYESLGFIREKRLFRFYLNGKDAFRLVLVTTPIPDEDREPLDSDPDSPLADDVPSAKTKYPPLTRPIPLLSPPPVRYFQVSPSADDDDDDEVSGR